MTGSKTSGFVGLTLGGWVLVACSGASAVPTDKGGEQVQGGATTIGPGAARADAGSSDPAKVSRADAGASQAAPAPEDAIRGEDGEPGRGEDGEVGRVASNEHCCFEGRYLRCPNADACFGGFDIGACLASCFPGDPCFEACFDRLGQGTPRGCDADAVPPPDVDCANGRIGD